MIMKQASFSTAFPQLFRSFSTAFPQLFRSCVVFAIPYKANCFKCFLLSAAYRQLIGSFSTAFPQLRRFRNSVQSKLL